MRLSTKKRLLWTGLLVAFLLARDIWNYGVTTDGIAMAAAVAVIFFVFLTCAAIDPEDQPVKRLSD